MSAAALSAAASGAEAPVAPELLLFEEPVVIAASKHEQKVTEAPASVTIVTADDIRKFGYRTLADVLRSVRGFYVNYDRGYAYIGVRGFNRPDDFGGRILLLVDGHRLNDPIYDTAASATDFILDVDLIDRVEIIRGPGSSLYGNNAFFAVINVITRGSHDFNGPEVSGSGGSFDTYSGRATYGQTFSNGVGVVLSGTYYDSGGDPELYFQAYDTPPTSDGVARHLDDDRSVSAFAHVTFKDISLEGAYVDRDKQNPTAKWGTVFGDPDFVTNDKHGYVELKFDHEFADAWHLLAKGYYDYYEYTGDYPYDYASEGDPPDVVINHDDSVAEWAGADLQLSKVVFEKHRLTGGAEYRNDFHVSLRNYDVDPYVSYTDRSIANQNAAAFFQDEFQVVDNLILSAGVRYDYVNSNYNRVNPRVALIYNPRPTTTLKFLYGTAFRAPNAYEAYYEDGGLTTKINPDLKPETVTTYELAGERSIGSHVRASLSGFYSKTDDLIGSVIDPSDELYIYDNTDKVKAYGTEVELEARWGDGMRGRASYTFAETENETTGKRLDNSPQHLVKLNLVAPLYRDKLFSGFELQYTSSRNTFDGGKTDGFTLANLTLSAQNFWRGLEASVSVYNLFDQEFSDPSASFPYAIEQDGITFRVKLTYRF